MGVLSLPRASASLLVTIEATGKARLGSIALPDDYAAMVEVFASNEKAKADDRVVVKADPRVPYGEVIVVMAAAHEAGIGQVGIASDRL